MSLKKTTICFIPGMLFSFAIGIWVGENAHQADPAWTVNEDATCDEREKSIIARLKSIAKERRQLEIALAKSQHQIEYFKSKQTGKNKEIGSCDDSTEIEGQKKATNEPAGVDWNRLYDIFKNNVDIFVKTCDLERNNRDIEECLSPDELASLQMVQKEWHMAGSRAKLMSSYPVIDADVLPDILQASLGGLLKLSGNQLDAVLEESMVDPLTREELESMTPLEAYTERLDLVYRLENTIPKVLDDAQVETWDIVGSRMIDLLRGEPVYARLGLFDDRNNSINWITRDWRDHYGFSKAKQDVLVDIADNYLENARDVFQLHGSPRGPLHKLEETVRDTIEKDLLNLQLATEREILEHISQEQFSRIKGKNPFIHQFELSKAITRRKVIEGGF